MTQATAMLDTYPGDLGRVNKQVLAACIEACFDCAQACTACADACLSEQAIAELTRCVRVNVDCADVCDATGRVLSRRTDYDANLTRALVQACIQFCQSCAEECEQHAHMPHCVVSARVCRRCEQTCQDLLSTLG
jgi:hypothetical protein